MRRLACVSLCLLGLGATARADLETARRQVEALDYKGARVTLERTLRAGTSDPSELADLYLLSGQVTAALGDDDASKEAFRRLLVIRPEAKLPSGTAPKIVDRFRAARKSLGQDARLRVRHELSAGTSASVTLVVESDPLGLVSRLRVRFKTGEGKTGTREEAGDSLRAALPASPRLEVTLAALDEHGNRLAMIGSEDAPLVVVGSGRRERARPVEPEPDDPEREPPARSMFARWPLWTGVAVAFAGAGVVFALQVRASEERLAQFVAEPEQHTYEEVQAEIDHGERMAFVTNASFVLAAGGAALALWFFIDERTDRASVAATPLPGGAAFSFDLRF